MNTDLHRFFTTKATKRSKTQTKKKKRTSFLYIRQSSEKIITEKMRIYYFFYQVKEQLKIKYLKNRWLWAVEKVPMSLVYDAF